MAIRYERFRFKVRATTEIRLPEYLGSTLRGSLGWALKTCCCVLRSRTCHDCPVYDDCGYAWLFETDRYVGGEAGNVNARPHPFVVEPPVQVIPVISSGQAFQFSLVLLDRAIDYLPVLVHAISIMGESGIGKGRKFGLGRFELESVSDSVSEVYNKEHKVLNTVGNGRMLSIECDHEEIVTDCRIGFLTPFRVKHGNRLHREVPFHLLIRTALRRISALELAYHGVEPDLDYRGLVQRAESVTVRLSSVNWQELFRFSNRQKKKVSLGGLVGESYFAGELSEFIPLLRYCEQVHIGKQTVFGLGAIDVGT